MQQFVEDFTIYMNLYAVNFQKSDQDAIEGQFSLFYKLYEQVQQQGGFIRSYSEQDSFLSEADSKIVRLYRKYFLSFEYYLQKKLTNFMDHRLLGKAHRVDVQKYLHNDELDWQNHQISVFTISPEQLLKINKNLFTLEAISKNHGNQVVDIRVQSPKTDSFRPKEYAQKKFQMTINQYLDYQRDRKGFLQTLINNGNSDVTLDNILFAVNVDMVDWVHETDALRDIIPELSFGSKDDGLSYLRQHILGLSIPQIYIKVSDVFTGGHQEHLAVSAININHGPGSSVWISIDQEFVPKVRQFVMKETQNDIIKEEGLWFRETEYFLQKGIEVKYTVQKPGEVIILGPGCLHLVRSEGISIQSAWNIMNKDMKMIKSMYNRYEINQEVNYPTIIPIKTLFLDIYNHESSILNHQVALYLQERLKFFYQEEKSVIDQMRAKINSKILKIEYKNHYHEIISCSGCWHEIFIYFYMKEGNKQGGLYDFYCVNCMEKELSQLTLRTGVIIMKYKAMVLGELIQQNNHNECLNNLCHASYVGTVRCKRQKQKSNYNIDYQKNIVQDSDQEQSQKYKARNQNIEVEINVEDTCNQSFMMVRFPKAIMGMDMQQHPTIELKEIPLLKLEQEKEVLVKTKIKRMQKPKLDKIKRLTKKQKVDIQETEELERQDVEVIPIKKKVKTINTNEDTAWPN